MITRFLNTKKYRAVLAFLFMIFGYFFFENYSHTIRRFERISVKLQIMNARMFMSRVKDIKSAKSLYKDEARFDDVFSDSRVRGIGA